MTELAHPATDYGVVEAESPTLLERNLLIGSRLWASSLVFFFFAFLFAYFYLRSLDQHGLFQPKGVKAPQAWGAVVAVCLAASAGLLSWGAGDQRSDRRALWRLKGLGALVLAVVAVVAQVVAWSRLGFGPTDGGYASVYLGWTGLYTIFVVGSLYWLETCLALSYRYRNEPFGKAEVEPGHASGDDYRETPDIRNPVHLNTASLAALTFTWTTMAAIGVVTWVVLYLV
jgi:heme/copper-type cytochrome/quinol oxidase subunit 3